MKEACDWEISSIYIIMGSMLLPVATNIPPPKQFNTDKMNFLRAGSPFFTRGIRSTHIGNNTNTVLRTTITNSNTDFVTVTKDILISLYTEKEAPL